MVVTLNVLAGQWEWLADLARALLIHTQRLRCFCCSVLFSKEVLGEKCVSGKKIIYVLSDDGIDVSPAHSHTRMTWDAILEARETPIHFLLYSQTALANIIPKRCLSGADQEKTFDR